MKPTPKNDPRITIDGVELSGDHAQFLPCRTYVQETPRDPIPESREIVESLESGEFQPCLQCGTCVATCSLSSLMDHPPRKLLLSLTLGHIEEALASNTLWLCLSCYQCTSRCPRGLKITDFIAALRDAVIRARVRQQEATLHEAYYAAIRQDHAGQLPAPEESFHHPEFQQKVLEELRQLHLEAKEQLLRYRKIAQKAKRSGKPQEALSHFDTHLTRYYNIPWYEEMRRIRDELLEWRDHASS